MVKEYYSHVLPITSTKKALFKYKTIDDRHKLSTDFESVKTLPSAAGILADNAVSFDFDANEKISADKILNILKAMVENEDINCRMSVSKGSHGGVHVTMLNNGSIAKNYTGVTLACGMVADIKCGCRNSYEILKLNNDEYPVLKDTLGTMPKYFQPIKNGTDFTVIGEGERTNMLGGWVRRLSKREGFTADESFTCGKIINKYVLKEPLSDDELYSAVLNQSTHDKCTDDFDTYGSDGKKGELTLTAFKKYIERIGISIKYNEVVKQIEFENLPQEWLKCGDVANSLPILLLDALKTKYKNLNKSIITDNIFVIADENRYNPVHEYFTAKKWDGIKRIKKLTQEVLSVTDEFYQMLIEKWLVQCVAISFNTLENPIQLEGVLILISEEEGIGKSRFFRALCPQQSWFRAVSNAINVQRKDDILNSIGGWIVEICEIDSTLCRKDSALKAFITNDIDRLRKPFAREETAMPRTTSFCGTTNKSEFLNDESGYRRYWCVEVEKINLKPLENSEFLMQIWAECYKLWKENPNYFRLTDAERAELKRRNEGKIEMVPAQDELMMILDFDAPKERWHWVQPTALKAIPAYNIGQYSAVTIGKALKAIEKLNIGVRSTKRNGISGYIIPPRKQNMNQFCNKI